MRMAGTATGNTKNKKYCKDLGRGTQWIAIRRWPERTNFYGLPVRKKLIDNSIPL